MQASLGIFFPFSDQAWKGIIDMDGNPPLLLEYIEDRRLVRSRLSKGFQELLPQP
jgi:hypothetical protein